MSRLVCDEEALRSLELDACDVAEQVDYLAAERMSAARRSCAPRLGATRRHRVRTAGVAASSRG